MSTGRKPAVDEKPHAGAVPPGADLVQVSPGRYSYAGGAAPEQVVAETYRHADGTLGIRPMAGCRNVRLSRGATPGILGVSSDTVVRLGMAGFVDVYHVSPGVFLLDLDSWFGHLRKVQEDPDFWDREGGNYRTYMLKTGMVIA